MNQESIKPLEPPCCGAAAPPAVVEIAGANKILKAKIPVDSGKTVELIGRSWAADSTAFAVPELDIALDAGYPVGAKLASKVFITHSHTDHIHHLTHAKSRTKPPTFFLPKESVSNTQKFLDAAQQLTSHLTTDEYEGIEWQPSYHFHGVAPGDRILVHPKRDLVCHPVACDHGVPCCGYIFSRIKKSLKDEYHGSATQRQVYWKVQTRIESLTVQQSL